MDGSTSEAGNASLASCQPTSLNNSAPCCAPMARVSWRIPAAWTRPSSRAWRTTSSATSAVGDCRLAEPAAAGVGGGVRFGEEFHFSVRVVRTANLKIRATCRIRPTVVISANMGCSRNWRRLRGRKIRGNRLWRNASDIGDFRSGAGAAAGIRSARAAQGSRPYEGRHPRIIRASRPAHGGQTAMACLSLRIPYGEAVTPEKPAHD